MHIVTGSTRASMARIKDPAFTVGSRTLARHWQMLVTRVLAHTFEILRADYSSKHMLVR